MSWNPWQFFARSKPNPDPDADQAGSPPPAAPTGPPDRDFPNTYRSANPHDGAKRPRLFDPALSQFPNAFRPGDPTFPDELTARRWAELRRLATDHVLRQIAESQWVNLLILRGSRLLKAWIGEAREPGDLDWVADPPLDRSSRSSNQPFEEAMFEELMLEELTKAVVARPGPEGVELVRDGVTTDEIWTYERAPGHRIVFPWRTAGLPGGSVQVDVVLNETLVDPNLRMSIPVADGGCVSVRAASPAQSLAWKLLWLASDIHPQGKDLYDAVLLAERFPLPTAVLEETLREGGEDWLPETAAEFVANWTVDWDNFRAEYPWVGGDGDRWLKRLEIAIGPTFGERTGADPGSKANLRLDPSWLTANVVDLASAIAANHQYDLLPILSDALQEAGCDRADILSHCLARGPHSQGCWVVDLILGSREISG